MQLTSALLRPQIMPAAPVPSAKPNLWILSSWRDLLLYVGTPLLLIPLFAVAQARWSAQDIYVFVAAFGATGHHLPGMIRAYGDPAVFQRFKWRFIFAPIFLLAICVAFTWWDLKGILLIVFFWGVWHGMMQTYGFCRIYDAKVGSFAAITRRLDFALCAVWFAAAVFLSSERMADTLEAYYASGAPQIPFGVLHQGQQIVLGIAIAVAVLFVANFARSWIVGKRPNPVKLALLGTSIAFWWFCNNGVTNILAGIALFEVFHDVQYLSLVWIYNRNRVEKDSSIGGFMRFIFRRSGSLIGLYIGLVFAYGMLGYFKERAEIDLIKRALTGLVAASGLLHFYYDGFIWKVRDRSTRESLGLSGGAVSLASNQIIPGWFLHGLKWGGIFVVPLTVLWIGQLSGPAPQVQREGWIVENFPSIASQRFHHAESLVSAGQLDLAAQEYRVGLSIDPKEEKAQYGLGHLLFALSKPEEGTQHLKEAVELDPKNAEFRADYGYALEHLGQKSEAASYYESALQLDPKSARVHYGYAMFLAQDGQIERALPEFEAAVRIKPDYTDAHYDLATALSLRGDLEGAKIHYLETARLSPKRSEPHNNLGVIYLREKQFPQAVAHLSQAVRLEPANNTAANNLKQAQALLAASDANNSNPR